jgi:hypothetical protein
MSYLRDEHDWPIWFDEIKRLVQEQKKGRTYGSSLLEYRNLHYKEIQYNPLLNNVKTIRLLRIKKSNDENDTVECELFTVTFDGNNDLPSLPSGEFVEYEALSWCWGKANKEYGIIIEQDGESSKKAVTKELGLALRYLRKKDAHRVIWIDAVCINQDNYAERNHQVQMMSLIYTRAKQVCVWLGEADKESRLAINFIHEKILNLKDFDSVSSDQSNVDNWRSLLMLMQRPWFSRRWVVQEIALGQTATVYCDWDEIKWTDFAIAVELFVEIETATHRLSEVMQKDPKYYHVPGWFEHVSQLGASLLVQATGKVFRQYKPLQAESQEAATSNADPMAMTRSTILPKPREYGSVGDYRYRRSLLSLEFLVSNLSTFKALEPRDVVYSLLAIAKDTAPFAEAADISGPDSEETLLRSTFSSFMEAKPFVVDYSRAYTDVCRDFIAFCVERACASDPTRALDILCRPWAPVPGKISEPMQMMKQAEEQKTKGQLPEKFKKRIRKEGWNLRSWKRSVPRSDPRNKEATTIDDNRTKDDYWKEATETWLPLLKAGGREEIKSRFFPKKPTDSTVEDGDATTTTVTGPALHRVPSTQNGESQATEDGLEHDLDLPSWVAKIDGASFALFPHAGMGHIEKVGRKNADALVGLPQEGQRNYSAAQTSTPDAKTLRFKKRATLGHYSLYVKGFILDEISEVTGHSQRGAIDLSWAKVGGWPEIETPEGKDVDTLAPPEAFWRTLVADRGKDNRNPPYYYAKACKESFIKGGIQSGSVDTSALINNEQNSIIAEFCRRVQAVIWNRCLIKTRSGTLGLANQNVRKGDLVCILYGCTVPVILRQKDKISTGQDGQFGLSINQQEKFEDQVEAFKVVMKKLEERYIRKHKLYPMWVKNDRSCVAALKKLEEDEDEDNDEEGEDSKSIHARLEEAGVTMDDLRCPKLYKEEIQQETKEINRKIRMWKEHEDADPRRRKKMNVTKDEDSERIHRQLLARQAVLRRAQEAKRQGHPRRDSTPQGGNALSDCSSDGAASDGPGNPVLETQDDAHGSASEVHTEDMLSSIFGQNGTTRDEDQPWYPKWKREYSELKENLNETSTEDDGVFYEFLGESYIHGMMDGEAIREQFHRKADKKKGKKTEGPVPLKYFDQRIFELR